MPLTSTSSRRQPWPLSHRRQSLAHHTVRRHNAAVTRPTIPTIAAVAVLALAGCGDTQPAAAPPSPTSTLPVVNGGTACTTAGATAQTSGGVVVTCANLTGRLTWQKVGTVSTATPTTPTTSAAVATTAPAPEPKPTIDEGVWTVGVDFPAGTYRVAVPVSDSCYWEITKSGTNGDDIIANDIVEGGRPTVTLRKGQDFTSKRCGTWEKIK